MLINKGGITKRQLSSLEDESFFIYIKGNEEKGTSNMIIVMKSTASKEDVEKVSGSVEKLGLRVNVVNGATQSVI